MGDATHHKVSNANFPLDEAGATYHVGCKRGDVANRIVTVGDPARAIALATLLDGGDAIDASEHKKFLNYRSKHIQIITSSRLFTTVTGRYQGVPVSIIAIGMGVPMIDFMVREVRAVVDGPLVMIRFGSCGSIGAARAGDVVLATKSQMCSRNVDYWLTADSDEVQSKEAFAAAMKSAEGGPYHLSQPVEADEYVAAALRKALNARIPKGTRVVAGLDTTADSFYSSQGRVDPAFDDANAHLIDYICKERKGAECLQMETFGLYHLARTARPLPGDTPSIRAAACAMVFAARRYNTWIDPDVQKALQAACSRAVLDAVIAVELDESLLHPEEGSCWAKYNDE